MYLPYATMGSGSLAAVSVLESKYKDNMTREEAKQLCTEAIEAGIFYDLGYWFNVALGAMWIYALSTAKSMSISETWKCKVFIEEASPRTSSRRCLTTSLRATRVRFIIIAFFSEHYLNLNEAFEKMEIDAWSISVIHIQHKEGKSSSLVSNLAFFY